MGYSEVIYENYKDSVAKAFDKIDAGKTLALEKRIIIKPNLVNASSFPVTTRAECCAAIIEYIRACSKAQIIIAEGCADPGYETCEIYEILGYTKIAEKYDVTLLDLNYEPLIKKEIRDCPFFPEMHLPKIIFDSFLLSVPVLKAHSLSTITGTLKNMLGVAPPEFYSGSGGIWRKAIFHEDIDQSIIDLNRYRTPDLTLLDASVGLAEHHLGGMECDPPVNKLLAGFFPEEIDKRAAELLGFDYKKIKHLQI
ncbi:MAG: DUF362 domain-containing protein [Desulfobacteraceae bacterium]|nr:DUF362 domain-containing protein [Desulfobacteraceae bacterium]